MLVQVFLSSEKLFWTAWIHDILNKYYILIERGANSNDKGKTVKAGLMEIKAKCKGVNWEKLTGF